MEKLKIEKEDEWIFDLLRARGEEFYAKHRRGKE